ncbi:type IV secretion protein Rhs [Pantoea sp. Acro-805]|uniref:Type IV secretion protein Rhs n=1 Tax=Candidatus Pantoea formicae TaxID=2608355 RepID=A0ABX0R0Y7_9GAMM|nr:type IV secretion protein Rhs [Pantoea formicae]NIF01221.1 type IV secretion protein Rhs [Pantoea formicae]
MKSEKKEGTLRLMTMGEIAMAQRVFGHSISYNRVWIHCDSYLPFGLQANNYGMTPNGELWFRKELYRDDFSSSAVQDETKHLFIHEMGHVWQHQQGMWVRMRGLVSWAASYSYQLDKDELYDYSLEQQASIIADYWWLLVYGLESWNSQKGINRVIQYRGTDRLQDIPMLYKKIVTGRRD